MQQVAEDELGVEEKQQVYVMGTRAMKKFKQLDADSSGVLEGGPEVMALAEWVWRSFHPKQDPSAELIRKEAEKILQRCDKNSDGQIGQDEFEAYYLQTAEAIAKFHKSKKAGGKKESKAQKVPAKKGWI